MSPLLSAQKWKRREEARLDEDRYVNPALAPNSRKHCARRKHCFGAEHSGVLKLAVMMWEMRSLITKTYALVTRERSETRA